MDAPRLIAVLPCYALDDIAKDLDEQVCREFHAAWTALWHPALLVRSPGIPEWKRSDQSSLDVEKAIVVAPSSAPHVVDTPQAERLTVQGCQLVWANAERSSTLQLLDPVVDGAIGGVAAALDWPPSAEAADERPHDLYGEPRTQIRLADFYALGFAYLMLQALTRKVHYSSNLDTVVLADQAKSAAAAYLANEPGECDRWLQSCFDQLSQERDRYFTQSAYLLDVTLLAPTTLGRSLETQLAAPHRQNLLAAADLLAQLKAEQPATWEVVRRKLEDGRLGLIGGLEHDRVHAWSPLGTLQRDLIRGHRAYQHLELPPPTVYSQFGPGMTMEFPTHLVSMGYNGAILHAFSEGSYPVTSQAKISWEATDKTTLDAISSAILDAASCRSMFNAINELAKQFDHHQVPTLVCAHWPVRTSAAFEDLWQAGRRTPAFGEWTTAGEYFATTGYVYSNQTFHAGEFKFPLPETHGDFSRRAVDLQRHLRRNARLESTRSMLRMLEQIVRALKQGGADRDELAPWMTAVQAFLDESDALAKHAQEGSACGTDDQATEAADLELLRRISELRRDILDRLRTRIPRDTKQGSPKRGWFLINPYAGARRVFLDALPGAVTKTPENRIYEALPRGNATDVIIDAPPMGIVRIESLEPTMGATFPSRRAGPNLASASLLIANEFIECQIDPKSGYLRSIMISKKRGGRLSGMPAVSLTDPGNKGAPTYSSIRNAQSRIIANSPLFGEIESRGELCDANNLLGTFQANYRLRRGARHLEVRLQLELAAGANETKRPLWERAAVWRTAWPSPAAFLSTWLQGSKTRLRTRLCFAPELIEIDDAEHRIYLAFQGLPLHRRVELGFLDTLLPVDERGRVDQTFQIAVDWPRPYQAYLEAYDEPWMLEEEAYPLAGGSSVWFAQSSLPNVRFELLDEGASLLRLLLHETQGKEGRVKLSFFRDAVKAARVDYSGKVLEELTIDQGMVCIDLKPNEISYLDVGF